MPRLIRPSLKYQESYSQVITKLQNAGVYGYADALVDLPAHIEDSAKDEDYSIFWLIEGDQYVGSIGIENEVLSVIGRMMHWYIERPVVNPREIERQMVKLGMNEVTELVLTKLLPREGVLRGSRVM